MNQPTVSKTPMALAIDIALNLLLVFGILIWCASILRPFISLIVWGGVIAIAFYPAYLKLRSMLGERRKLTVALIALVGVAVVIVPLWSFTSSTIETAIDLRGRVSEGELVIPPASEAVREWPIVGEPVYGLWSKAATNLSGFVEAHNAQIRNVVATMLNRLAGVGIEALQFLVSILIAAAFLYFADAATVAMRSLFTRLAGRNGDALRRLSVATVRSIAVGVLGIAIIQALFGGIGMLAIGVPGAGVWALLILLVAIMQLPPWLILFPVAAYVFSVESTAVAGVFAAWSVVVSFADMVLKPMLLGRGVDAPMIVILIGAIGGMISSGIIGLFVGAVVLGVSFKLLQVWLASDDPGAAPEAIAPTAAPGSV